VGATLINAPNSTNIKETLNNQVSTMISTKMAYAHNGLPSARLLAASKL
jgi:hypothetical protein